MNFTQIPHLWFHSFLLQKKNGKTEICITVQRCTPKKKRHRLLQKEIRDRLFWIMTDIPMLNHTKTSMQSLDINISLFPF